MAWNQNEFDDACRRFRNFFPDFETFDCPGERYVTWERADKDKLVELYRSRVQPALTDADAEFFRAYVEILNPAAIQFVDWRFAGKLSTLARSDNHSTNYGNILKRVIELDGSSDSITTYGKEAFECLKSVYGPKINPPYSEIRCLATLLLMLHDPSKFMCEKLGVLNDSTKLLLEETLVKQSSLVTNEEFDKCQDFAKRVCGELERSGFHPKDMIDVQSFLFTITRPKTWNQRAFEASVVQFKQRYPGFEDFKNCGNRYIKTQRTFKQKLRKHYNTNVKPLIEFDSVEFMNAYAKLIDLYTAHRPEESAGWRALTTDIPSEKKAEFGSMLQSIVNAKATSAKWQDWKSLIAEYDKKSKQLLESGVLSGDSDQMQEKLRESATLLLALRWPQKYVHAVRAVWNVAGSHFLERELIESDHILSVDLLQDLFGFTRQISDGLVESNFFPKGQSDKSDIYSFLWSVYDELKPQADLDSPNDKDSVHKQPNLTRLIQGIRSSGMRIDEPTVRQYHFSMRTRGFVILAGPSGVGKTWLTRLYSVAFKANYLLAPVAPNWSTNEDLLGFFNPIDGEFHATAFLDFIDQAAESWDRDGLGAKEFHLVLDEMNLARVEHYFSLFLSLMETRRDKEVPEAQLAGGRVVRVPPNLKFAGTVNMDETTHGFADKVFDRAQLIELSISPDAARKHVSKRIGETPAAEVLLDLWDRMAPACPVGFRVLDEIAEYLKLAEQEDVDWREALDEQIVSKLLPKLRGIDPEVAEVLKLIETRVNGEFPKAAAKCQSMLRRMQSTDVVSFF